MSTMLSLLTIFMMLFQSNQAQLGMPGGWSSVPADKLERVQIYCELAQVQIVNLMKLNGYNLSTYCKPLVTSAEEQVVAGMNFKADIEICGFGVTVQFFVPLPINGDPQLPQDVQLISGQLPL